MLTPLAPEDPTREGWVYVIAALYFFVCALYFRRIADWVQKRKPHSDKLKSIGISLMRPLLFLFSALALWFAYSDLTGRM
jgi:hypothetical protein